MSDKSICIICLDDLNWHESEIVSLECGHVFDNICLEQWLETTEKCPICKRDVDSSVTRRLYISQKGDDPSHPDYCLVKNLKQTINTLKFDLAEARELCSALTDSFCTKVDKCEVLEAQLKKKQNELDMADRKYKNTEALLKQKLKVLAMADKKYKVLEAQLKKKQNELDMADRKYKNAEALLKQKLKELAMTDRKYKNEAVLLKQKLKVLNMADRKYKNAEALLKQKLKELIKEKEQVIALHKEHECIAQRLETLNKSHIQRSKVEVQVKAHKAYIKDIKALKEENKKKGELRIEELANQKKIHNQIIEEIRIGDKLLNDLQLSITRTSASRRRSTILPLAPSQQNNQQRSSIRTRAISTPAPSQQNNEQLSSILTRAISTLAPGQQNDEQLSSICRTCLRAILTPAPSQLNVRLASIIRATAISTPAPSQLNDQQLSSIRTSAILTPAPSQQNEQLSSYAYVSVINGRRRALCPGRPSSISLWR